MAAFWKSVGVAIVGGIVGGTVPNVVGSPDVKTLAANALATAAIGLIALWMHKPGTEPTK